MSDFLLRHAFVDNNKGQVAKKRIPLGSSTAGVILDITIDGIEINGYYKLSATSEDVYGTLRKPLVIMWEDLSKFREELLKPKKEKKEKGLEGKETDFDIKYLKTLPKVHLNGIPYYIDVSKKEMRAVATPRIAFKLQGG